MARGSRLCAGASITAALLTPFALPGTAPAAPAAAPAPAAVAPAPPAPARSASGAPKTPDDGPSARALAREARTQLLRARSVHLGFTDHRAGGDRTAPASLELTLDRGGNCVGKLVMGDDGGSVALVKRGDQVWMKPDAAFWKAQLPDRRGDAVAARLKNRYLHGSTKAGVLRGMSGTCDLSAFQRIAAAESSPRTALTKGKETKVDGTKVIPLTGTEHDGKKITLYVTSAGPHRLVRATRQGAGTDQDLTFTGYDKPVPSATPAPAQSVDISELQRELERT
ncbi:hypothetical protein GCM10010300_54680 [Streptomyces olivaceoviridis]|uniref:hypothetical protein n=1 Tax=Streptomyces olivaceoviridis TaxID=1921 RepID=UPI00167A6171|nr:hypothetical protein [Streptomyces olivaceoviridis]GGZ03945.1 hypothetical protein GCM10010300_54680 [Streptomyces olivaceoviridis]